MIGVICIHVLIIPIIQALAPNMTWVVGGSLGLSLTTLFMDICIFVLFYLLNLLLPIV